MGWSGEPLGRGPQLDISPTYRPLTVCSHSFDTGFARARTLTLSGPQATNRDQVSSQGGSVTGKQPPGQD